MTRCNPRGGEIKKIYIYECRSRHESFFCVPVIVGAQQMCHQADGVDGNICPEIPKKKRRERIE